MATARNDMNNGSVNQTNRTQSLAISSTSPPITTAVEEWEKGQNVKVIDD